MSTNKKNYLLLQIISFMFLLGYLPNCFGNSNDDHIIKVKIADQKSISETLNFDAPYDQKIIIENQRADNIILDKLFFASDELAAPLIARSISTKGYAACSTIKAHTSCHFIINAAKNATPTTKSKGNYLLFGYKTAEENTPRFVSFETKINYNNKNIISSTEEIETSPTIFAFSKESFSLDQTNLTSVTKDEPLKEKKLKLTNINPEYSINIHHVTPAQNSANIKIMDYNGCSKLKTGESCEINIATQHDAIPLYVTYDTIDTNNRVIVSNLTTVITTADKESEIQVARASLDGIVTAATIEGIYNNHASLLCLVKPIFVTLIGKNPAADFMNSAALGFTSSFIFPATHNSAIVAGKYFDTDIEYNEHIEANKLIETSAIYTILGLFSCYGKPNYLYCVVLSTATGIAAVLFSRNLAEFYHGVLSPQYEKSLTVFTKVVTRITLRSHLVPNVGWPELVSELAATVPESVSPGITDIKKRFPEYFDNISKNYISILDNDCTHKECVCTDLAH